MLLNLTEFAVEPLHEQVSQQLIERILEQGMVTGSVLESPRSVARTQRISVTTARKAYETLERLGLIQKRADSGFAVTEFPRAEFARRFLNREDSSLKTVQHFSEKIQNEFEPAVLTRLFEVTLFEGLQPSRMSVFFCKSEGETLSLNCAGSDHPTVLSSNDTGIAELLEQQGPIDPSSFRARASHSRFVSWVLEEGFHLVVPLRDDRNLLGIVGLSDSALRLPYSTKDLKLLEVLCGQFSYALVTAFLHEELLQKRRYEQDLNTAHLIQKQLLPATLPEDESFDLSVYCEPSLPVGGDFYDVFWRDEDRLSIVIGDARGKGLSAALLASQVHSIIRSESTHAASISQTLSRVNNRFSAQSAPEHFVTVFYAEFNLRTSILEYVNAGHNYPFLITRNGQVKKLCKGGLLLGVVPHAVYETGSVRLQPGDRLCLYTDGVTEAEADSGEQYGEARLIQNLQRIDIKKPNRVIDQIIEDVQSFEADPESRDDRTCLLIERRNINQESEN